MPTPIRFDRNSSGVAASAPHVALEVTALAPGVLRILAGPAELPEAASWAVLPERAAARAAVTHDAPGAVAARFTCGPFAVGIDADLRVAIHDARSGAPICVDHETEALRFAPDGVRLRKRVGPDERFYGLGDKPGPLQKRGHAYAMWNTDAYGFQEAWDPLYKAIPFLLSVREGGRAYGLFLDATHRSAFDLCVADADTLGMSAAAPALRLYVLAGPTARDVLARWAWLVGRTPMPPIWSLGYGQSRYSYETQEAFETVARTHREKRIPLDAVWLDIGFQDRNRPFTVDAARFPDLAGAVASLRAEGIHTAAITDLHIPAVPGENYAPCESLLEGGHALRAGDGSPYVGEVWPGPCHFPDFTRAATRDWWGGLYEKFHLQTGIAGFWNDMNEPAVFDGPGHTMPPDNIHRIEEPGFAPRDATHAEIHNVYGMQNARATHDGLRRLAPDRRPFVLTRASYAGGHRHAATWTGDNTSTSNHLRLATPQLLSLGLSGFALAGCDIGGFRRDAPADLLTQWIAVGAFHPLFRNHTDKDTAAQEAWVHGPAHEARRRAAIEQRYRLLPYLYTSIEETSRTGVPLMRPLFLEFDEARLLSEDTMFMFGPALLVAPPPDDSAGPYTCELPEGTIWYDWHTGAPVTGTTRTEPRRPGHVAVFARGGCIVPVQPVVQHTGERPAGPLALHVFPDAAGCAAGTLYADDGTSFAHQDGDFFRQSFAWSEGALHAGPAEGDRPCPFDGFEIVTHGEASGGGA